MLRGAIVKVEEKREGKNTEKKRPVYFPGLCRDAKTLGVHRNHLYQVLSGRRVSRTLKRRYNALKKGAGN